MVPRPWRCGRQHGISLGCLRPAMHMEETKQIPSTPGTFFRSCFKGKSEPTLPGVLGTVAVAWWSHSLFRGTEKQSPLLKASGAQAYFSLHPLWLPFAYLLPCHFSFLFPSSLPSSLSVSFPCFSPLPPASFPFLLSLLFHFLPFLSC